MTSFDRFLDPPVQLALERLRDELLPPWFAFGPPVIVEFAQADRRVDVRHGLNQIPDAFLTVNADTYIRREPGVLWTPDLASVRAAHAPAHGVVMFFKLRGSPV